jgi:glucose-6-phosphate isomerase
MLAAIHLRYLDRGKTISVMMPYSYQLKDMADWFRQIWAESLGKRVSADGRKEVFTGLTPIKALGVTDQHSQVQLYREGPNDKVFTLLEVGKFARDVAIPDGFPHVEAMSYLGDRDMSELFRAELDATRLALLASGRPCLTVHFPRIDEWTIGQFIYLYEAATTITGMMLGIDPYNQPGVELGKQITFHLMGRKGFVKFPQGGRPQGESPSARNI